MPNKRHDGGEQVSPPHTPKDSGHRKGEKRSDSRPKFQDIHKAGGHLDYPKNIGGSVKGKHEALDVLD